MNNIVNSTFLSTEGLFTAVEMSTKLAVV